jgi:hypothetical protein
MKRGDILICLDNLRRYRVVAELLTSWYRVRTATLPRLELEVREVFPGRLYEMPDGRLLVPEDSRAGVVVGTHPRCY